MNIDPVSLTSNERCYRIARGMLAYHPYNTWPLRVKIFTEEALKFWEAYSQTFPSPEGLSVTIELEGVDGKSGKPGSGRMGPIDVTDGMAVSHEYYVDGY